MFDRGCTFRYPIINTLCIHRVTDAGKDAGHVVHAYVADVENDAGMSIEVDVREERHRYSLTTIVS